MEYRLALGNRFQVLQEILEEETIDKQWRREKDIVTLTCKEILRHIKYNHKEWITPEALEKETDSK